MAEKHLAIEVSEQKSMTDSERRQLKIFISHKHENMEYADAIRNELLDWGFTNESVHQSSSAEASAPVIGKDLAQSIRDFLHACNLVIFIYTRNELNWEWCSYEIGVADDPIINNNVAIFQMFNDVPKIHTHRRIVQFNETDVEKFVRDFHKRSGFFPGYGTFFPNIESAVIERRATRLVTALKKAKDTDPHSVQTIAERDLRYGYFRVRIDGKVLDPLYEKWNNPEGAKVSIEEVRLLLRANLRVTESQGWGLLHLGVSEGQKDHPVMEAWTLERLETQWKESLPNNREVSWLDDLVDDIWRFRNASPPKLSWEPFESAFSKELFYPIIMHTYIHPDGSREYDIYTILMAGDGPQSS